MASQSQIDTALDKHEGFMGAIGSDELPAWTSKDAPKNFSFVVNMSRRNDPDGGTHWLAVWSKDGRGYWFDSYGNAPDEDDRNLGKLTHFREWLNNVFGGNWDYNKVDLQSWGKSDVCGEWSVMAVKIGTLPTPLGPYGTEWWPLMFNPDGTPKDAVDRDRSVFKAAALGRRHMPGFFA